MTATQRERRIHRVFVTRNTEYHVRRDVCVAVRDRSSGRWLPGHSALHRRVAGALALVDTGGFAVRATLPREGESIVFDGEGTITSPVTAIERPERHIVAEYPKPLLESVG